MHKLRYRQIHLDFHTSEAISGIGAAWDKAHWQKTLSDAHVNVVNCFATCHHGWSYYPTMIGMMHPHLDFDLTRAQYDACREIDVAAQLYITVGVNNMVARAHPEWRAVNAGGTYYGWEPSPVKPGFHMLCFGSPYLDYVCDEIKEVATLFPEGAGLWLDIIHKADCCCSWCTDGMAELGLDAEKPADRWKYADIVLDNYYQKTLAAVRSVHPTMPIFQNSGHVQRGERRFFSYVTHLELESLPTWGWGYDHFPMSAKYAKLSGLDFLGMTGKFHTTWGEFGGFKHPNALRYECAAMLAYGGKCSVGDQLHPSGKLDESTYRIIGEAYSEVEAKEPWCEDSVNIADIAILSSVAVNPSHPREDPADTGASRVLLEGHFLFDIIDSEMDLAVYKLIILPDDVIVDDALKANLDEYLAAGGKLLLTGKSGLDTEGKPLFDIGAEIAGESEFELDFILPAGGLRPEFVDSPFVVYATYPRIKVTGGESLGEVYAPYFNRTYKHFCSHQHAPARPQASGYDCGVRNGSVMYLPMPIFTLYGSWGAVTYKQFALNCIKQMLGEDISLRSNIPSTARVTLTEQPGEKRYVLHLLHANIITRGESKVQGFGVNSKMEVIEDLLPLHDVRVSLSLPKPVERVTLEPQGVELAFSAEDGRVDLAVDSFKCHQMVALHTGQA